MEDGRRPLVLAAIEGHDKVIECLLNHGAEPNHVYFDSFTALSVAASNRHHAVMNILLRGGALPDLIGSQKHRPLINSILIDDMEGVILLLQHGAVLDEGLGDNKHPLEVAAVKNLTHMFQLVLSLECDVNVLQQILRDGAIVYFVEEDSLLYALKATACNPRSLQMLCRHRVTQRLPPPRLPNIERLPVPRMIQDYLAMKELNKEWLRPLWRRSRPRSFLGD